MDWTKIKGIDFYTVNPGPQQSAEKAREIQVRSSFISSLQEANRRKVDELNAHRSTWKQASAWEQVKYFVENPLAVMKYKSDSARWESGAREEARVLARRKIGAYGYSGLEAAQIDVAEHTIEETAAKAKKAEEAKKEVEELRQAAKKEAQEANNARDKAKIAYETAVEEAKKAKEETVKITEEAGRTGTGEEKRVDATNKAVAAIDAEKKAREAHEEAVKKAETATAAATAIDKAIRTIKKAEASGDRKIKAAAEKARESSKLVPAMEKKAAAQTAFKQAKDKTEKAKQTVAEKEEALEKIAKISIEKRNLEKAQNDVQTAKDKEVKAKQVAEEMKEAAGRGEWKAKKEAKEAEKKAKAAKIRAEDAAKKTKKAREEAEKITGKAGTSDEQRLAALTKAAEAIDAEQKAKAALEAAIGAEQKTKADLEAAKLNMEVAAKLKQTAETLANETKKAEKKAEEAEKKVDKTLSPEEKKAAEEVKKAKEALKKAQETQEDAAERLKTASSAVEDEEKKINSKVDHAIEKAVTRVEAKTDEALGRLSDAIIEKKEKKGLIRKGIDAALSGAKDQIGESALEGVTEQGKAFVSAFKDGDRLGMENAALEGLANIVTFPSRVASLAENIVVGAGNLVLDEKEMESAANALESVMPGISNVVPGLAMFANGLKVLAGANKVIDARSRIKAAESNEKEISEIAKVRGSDDNMAQWVAGVNRHASQEAKINRDSAIVETATGATRVAAAGVNMSGVGCHAGTILSAGAAVVDFVNEEVANMRRKTAMEDRVNEVTNLDAHMQKLMDECPGLPRSDAKHMILQQWGYKSGKRSEVFLNIAKKDAALIQQMDATPDEESRKVAGMLKGALGVHEKAGQEALMEAMGVDKESAKNIDAAIAQKRAKDRTSGIFRPKIDPHRISVGLPHVPMAAAPKPQVAITPKSPKSKTAGNNL
jgi:hypothetical protein